MPKPRLLDTLRRPAHGATASVAALPALVGALLFLQIAAASAQVNLLPPEEAFRFSARALDPRTVEATFTIADGYYLYRDKLRFAVATAGMSLVAPALPAGKVKDDPYFGRVETYRDRVVIRLPIDNAVAGAAITMRADSQGCADVGVCYPPNTQSVTLALPSPGEAPGPSIDATPAKKRWF